MGRAGEIQFNSRGTLGCSSATFQILGKQSGNGEKIIGVARGLKKENEGAIEYVM
jgi:hypothetical protein